MKTRHLAIFGAAAVAGMLGACAQQVGDIDRTQPNRISKAELGITDDPETNSQWYYHQTIINTNATARTTSTGSYGDMERISWEVTEDSLIAYRTHEDVIGIETTDIGLPSTNDNIDPGRPVASFAIQSHFDVQRQYNSSTGEPSNVIVENSSDRHWYERDWMRVDWSNSQVHTVWDEIGGIEAGAAVTVAPQDNGDDPTWFVEYDDDGNIIYIDVVQTYVVEVADWFDCALSFGWPLYGGLCGPETVQVRTSISRVDLEDDYQPRIYTERDMTQFGYFRTERCAYDGRFGCTDDSRVLLANNWNIWERWLDDDGNEIPMADRQAKPIVYYVSPNFPLDLIDETYEIANQYDHAFARIVETHGATMPEGGRMFYVCLNPGSENATPPELEEARAYAFNDADEALLEAGFAASAEAYQLGYCERPEEVKNYGDVRYSMINWVNNEPNSRWLGLGPSWADPLTGQIINAYANIAGAGLNTYAQWALNIVNVINGEYSAEELGFGQPMQDYFASLGDGADGIFFGFDKDDDDLTPLMRDIDRRMREQRRIHESGLEMLERPHVQQILNGGLANLSERTRPAANPLERIVDTPLEDAMMVPALVNALEPIAEMMGTDVYSDAVMDYASPARVGNVMALNERIENENNRLRGMNAMLFQDFDWMIVGLAREFAALDADLQAAGMTDFQDRQNRLFYEIRARIYRAVTEHELGHTVGLRHNFAASADALNYFPQYWALREATFNPDCDGTQGYETFEVTGMVTGAVAPVSCTGESNEEYLARAAQAQQDLLSGTAGGNDYQGIYEYAYASIMDYGARANTDFAGLGLYDLAALAYSYGGLVEVFNTPPHMLEIEYAYDQNASLQTGTITRSAQIVENMEDVDFVITDMPQPADYPADAPEWDRTIRDTPDDNTKDNPWTHYHYSTLPIMFEDLTTADAIDAESQGLLEPYFQFDGLDRMAAIYDRSLVPLENTDPTSPQYDGSVRVPYRFCSDEYRGGQQFCQVFDGGADEQELLEVRRVFYENYYVVDYFRRGRPGFGFDILPILNRSLSRAFNPMIDIYQHWIIQVNEVDKGIEWYGFDWAGGTGWDVSQQAVNNVLTAMSAPTIGTYAWNRNEGVYMNISDQLDFEYRPDQREEYSLYAGEDHINLTVQDGARYGTDIYPRIDEEYYHMWHAQVMSHFWGKWAAIMAATDGSIYVVGLDQSSGSGNYWLDSYAVWPEEVSAYFGGILNEDYHDIGACVRTTDDGTEVTPMLPISGQSCTGPNDRLLNPYTELYGNGDLNMRNFAAIYPFAYTQSNLDMSFFDNAGVYIAGRGEEPRLMEVCDNGVDDDLDGDADCNDTECVAAEFCTSDEFAGCYVDADNGDFTNAGRSQSRACPAICGEAGSDGRCTTLNTFTDDEGITYVAFCPQSWNPASHAAVGGRVGCDLVQRAIDMQIRADLGEIQQYEVDSHVETMRLVVQSNRYYNDLTPIQYEWLTSGNPF